MPPDSRLRYGSVSELSPDGEPRPSGELPPRPKPTAPHGPVQRDGDPTVRAADRDDSQGQGQPGDLFRPRKRVPYQSQDAQLSQSRDAQLSDPVPDTAQLPRYREPLPERGVTPPDRSGFPPQRDDAFAWRGNALPAPPPAEPIPGRGDAPPSRGDAPPSRGDPLPSRGDPLPSRGDPLPGRGDVPEGGELLPRRTGRTRPRGRHRSPHRLTVASDAPSLVLAVPGAATDATAALAGEVASAVQLSCPGVDVRIGFMTGESDSLDVALEFQDAPASEIDLRAVVVPLLVGPHPALDAQLAELVSRAADPVMLASHLGPHPLLAEALHDRLADAGLARAGRARGLSIVTGVNGILVLADRGDEAIKEAGVTAVLLAARLAVPAVPASLGDAASVSTALTRLRETGASRPAISLCVIGPEAQPQEMKAIRSMLDAPSAPPIGAHPAIAQLIAIRYGAALARLAMASSAG
jgi:hypothetical protein